MPANQTYNPRQTRTIDTPVREFAVATGSIIVTDIDGQPVGYTLAGESLKLDPPQAGLTVYSPDSAQVSVFYGDEEGSPDPEPPAASRKRVHRSRPKQAAKRAKPTAKSTKSSAAKTSKKTSKKKG